LHASKLGRVKELERERTLFSSKPRRLKCPKAEALEAEALEAEALEAEVLEAEVKVRAEAIFPP
jgi:hypothetical protein